ncbi:glycosyltransferase family 4 protein [Leptothoe spongobia]|uniref:Glycosyltransferase family 4 protein n=1 Tax=Leptothoe spongobia TAU-MAC 1115 TaxID=1967444 RepID=A0A947GSJ3_9CYAN|nr:glycosyltransferase family 4 protein [Leptothoe spongobia]MBT9317981.1 glycosyltransferase family 4 protein [Leptothoe spongobia TAU-MAC 1115]
MTRCLKLLFVSTPVGPLGSGLGGGVELTVVNLVTALTQRGHQIEIAAPESSQIEGARLIQIPGILQPTAHTQGRDTPAIMMDNAVLANQWAYVRQVQHNYDLIVNFAYDWLPFYLTPFFEVPIAHFVSMGSLSRIMDQAVTQLHEKFPGTLGAYTQAQIDTFPQGLSWQLLSSAVDLSQYIYCETPESELVWLGRISPEKGLEDAVAAAQYTQTPLKILGKLENTDYWNTIQSSYPDAPVDYLGFVNTQQLQTIVRRCQGLLMTPRWVEAFGNVAIEALACGVPVVAYRRGGPAEIIEHGKTGWLVEPDSVEGLVQGIQQLGSIDRHYCRQQAENKYSLPALGQRFENWFNAIIQQAQAG